MKWLGRRKKQPPREVKPDTIARWLADKPSITVLDKQAPRVRSQESCVAIVYSHTHGALVIWANHRGTWQGDFYGELIRMPDVIAFQKRINRGKAAMDRYDLNNVRQSTAICNEGKWKVFKGTDLDLRL